MKDHLITDFLKVEDFKNIKSKKYLELPDFDKNFNFSKDIIFNRNWKNHNKKISDMKKILKCIIIF